MLRRTTVTQPTQIAERIPEYLKMFEEFSLKYLKIELPSKKEELAVALREYFAKALDSFYAKISILNYYNIETIFIEQILTVYISRVIPQAFVSAHTDALVKDNKFQLLSDSVKQRKVNDIKKHYISLEDKGSQWEFLKSWLTVDEIADTIVFEMKTRHYDKLMKDVVIEFRKYKEQHKQFMINRDKFTVFREDLGEQHEMLKAARKFNTVVGKFDILSRLDRLKDEGIDYTENKIYLMNKQMKKIIKNFAYLE